MLHYNKSLSRILLGTLSLVTAWAIGGCVATLLYPRSALVNRMETLSSKVGCSVAVRLASLILGRYVLRSLRLAPESASAPPRLSFYS